MSYEHDKITIKSWKEEDRPREKLLFQGRRHLSDAELIAILIGSGNKQESAVELSKRILNAYSNDLNQLSKLSVQEFVKFNGIGDAKAISIIAALELGRRRKEQQSLEKPKITCSRDAYDLLAAQFRDLQHEEFWVLLLNRANLVLAKHLVSKGGQSGTIADPKIIFNLALLGHASAVLLAHNHPSGNLQPSKADCELTTKLVSGAKLLDLQVVDHLILSDSGYFSFADEAMI
jgi:DNA repair protein RadC